MKKYKVFYSFNGKKYFSEVFAENEDAAKIAVLDKISFIKVENEPEIEEPEIEYLKNIFGMK
jgi:hypothetical protein